MRKNASSALEVFCQVPQLRKYQLGAGELAGIEAAGHAENDGGPDDARRGAGQDGRRADLLHAELGEKRAERGEFLGEQGADRFDGHILGRDAGPAGHEQDLGRDGFHNLTHRHGDRGRLIGNHPMVEHVVTQLLGALLDPMPAGVLFDGAGSGKCQDGDADLSGRVLLVLAGSHGFSSLIEGNFLIYFTLRLEINRFFSACRRPRSLLTLEEAAGLDHHGGRLTLTFPIIA